MKREIGEKNKTPCYLIVNFKNNQKVLLAKQKERLLADFKKSIFLKNL